MGRGHDYILMQDRGAVASPACRLHGTRAGASAATDLGWIYWKGIDWNSVNKDVIE